MLVSGTGVTSGAGTSVELEDFRSEMGLAEIYSQYLAAAQELCFYWNQNLL